MVKNILGFAAHCLRYLRYVRLGRGGWTNGFAQQHHRVIDLNTVNEAGDLIGFGKA